jgi:hypothetical protein
MKQMMMILAVVLLTACSKDSEVKAATMQEAGKTLVVYYSYTGNYREIVNSLTAQIDADVMEIQPAEKGLKYEANNYALGTQLPKFKPHTISEKGGVRETTECLVEGNQMQVLWLRFLTEIGEDTKEVPKELIENAEVKQAIEIVEESAYTDDELAQYDKFWDAIRIEQAFVDEAEIRYGLGIKKAKTEDTRKMKAKGYAIEDIAEITGLTAEEIEGL